MLLHIPIKYDVISHSHTHAHPRQAECTLSRAPCVQTQAPPLQQAHPPCPLAAAQCARQRELRRGAHRGASTTLRAAARSSSGGRGATRRETDAQGRACLRPYRGTREVAVNCPQSRGRELLRVQIWEYCNRWCGGRRGRKDAVPARLCAPRSPPPTLVMPAARGSPPSSSSSSSDRGKGSGQQSVGGAVVMMMVRSGSWHTEPVLSC